LRRYISETGRDLQHFIINITNRKSYIGFFVQNRRPCICIIIIFFYFFFLDFMPCCVCVCHTFIKVLTYLLSIIERYKTCVQLRLTSKYFLRVQRSAYVSSIELHVVFLPVHKVAANVVPGFPLVFFALEMIIYL